MRPFYLELAGGHAVAAIYQAATGAPASTGVLLVPPFGWDDQTSYRPRRDWSLALAANGLANVRIDLPGTGDSSGNPGDDGLVDSWTAAVASGVDWLRSAGAERVAVIALGAGGLVTLHAIASGVSVDDLVLWGVPARGRTLLRELKAFSRLEQSETGEPLEDMNEGELTAGGHVLAPATVAALSALDAATLVCAGAPRRTLLMGRDGIGPDEALLKALHAAGADVRTDPGHGWGAALARPQSASPTAIFKTVGAWLIEAAKPGSQLKEPLSAASAELGSPGARVRETPLIFEGAGQQLYAILTEPVDAPQAYGTAVLFNAGAIRRIGPNRMWTEVARRWAAAGVPVMRVDIEGIGDAGGDGTRYLESDETFYTQALIDQSRAALDLALERSLPDRFLLGGLCSGGFWAFQLALADPRVRSVMALNPRMLIFDPHLEGRRELRRLRRILTRRGFRKMVFGKGNLMRFWRLIMFLGKLPQRFWRRPEPSPADALAYAFKTLHGRGQRVDMAFSGDEPFYRELQEQGPFAGFEDMGINFHDLPYTSHTLKPLRAQKAAHAVLDEVFERTFFADVPVTTMGRRPDRRWVRSLARAAG